MYKPNLHSSYNTILHKTPSRFLIQKCHLIYPYDEQSICNIRQQSKFNKMTSNEHFPCNIIKVFKPLGIILSSFIAMKCATVTKGLMYSDIYMKSIHSNET